jgi:hypothetical protein
MGAARQKIAASNEPVGELAQQWRELWSKTTGAAIAQPR